MQNRDTQLELQTLSRCTLKEWSLITGRGATKREGGHVKLYPYEKGGMAAENALAILKGGDNKFWGSFYVIA